MIILFQEFLAGQLISKKTEIPQNKHYYKEGKSRSGKILNAFYFPPTALSPPCHF